MSGDSLNLDQPAPITGSKNVLGYQLIKRIGSGGFGEVWSAEAPGGLMKAVKFVYGYHDEKRAQGELKALDRVKELRHPFLLSLERFEVFEGQLIVVSELADKSMADLFNEYAIKGEPGIPREQLVKYIRDAADALDYLSNEHKLQHLDIKPENLLMVGQHVKVADFGLVKDLHNASLSLMSGMTPAYAAPELFDGKPGPMSDQYSLAIVYQEMLTSLRPFPGTTPAQLAAQHMHGKPNLRPLAKDDQPIIARALSKDPNVRFGSCLEMAEELLNRKRSRKKSVRRIESPTRTSENNDSPTLDFDSQPLQQEMTAIVGSEGLPFQANAIQTLDPPDCDENDAVARPVLLVGVGLTANRVIQKIKNQIEARHGSMEAVPSVKLLAIDADADDLSQLSMIGTSGALNSSEIIETPLLKPEAYRKDAGDRLSWLSRRWIYNIPRSLRTEGLRPLGRLLFASCFETLYERLRASIDQIVKPELLATTADTLDLNPGEIQPRVFIVSSISGGIGSGMTLDLAYTIKLLMAERGLKTDTVTGMLLHSSYQRKRDAGLAAANAFAFLTELRHFVEHGYPGDETLGIPDFEGEMPFDHTYYRHLGNDLSQTDFDNKLGSLAEYLYHSSMSKCSVFLDACRDSEEDCEHFSLRTFGLSLSGPGNLETADSAANRIVRGLLRRWTYGDPDIEIDSAAFAREILQSKGLTAEMCHQAILERVEKTMEGSFDSLANGATSLVMRVGESAPSELASYLEGMFGCSPDQTNDDNPEPEICVQMNEQIGSKAMVVSDELCTALLDLMQQPQLELSSVKSARDACEDQLEQLLKQLEIKSIESNRTAADCLSVIAERANSKSGFDPDDRESVAEIVTSYCACRLDEFVLRYSRKFLKSCQHGLTFVSDQVAQFSGHLEIIASHFAVTDEEILLESHEDDSSMDRLLNRSIEKELPKQVEHTEAQVFQTLISERGGYYNALSQQGCWQHRLPAALKAAAQQVLAESYKKISLDKIIVEQEVGPEQLVKWLNEKINRARPEVDDCGGASRMMLGLPALSQGDSLVPEIVARQFSIKSKPIYGTRGDIVICFEGEDVSLASVAYRLLEARPDAIELVKRIHTRNDVDWTSLNDLL